jgi:hypothetical protein
MNSELTIIVEKKNLPRDRDALRHGVAVLLKVNGKSLDVDSLSRSDPIIHQVAATYWRIIKKLQLPGCGVLVRLSGLHYDPFTAKDLMFSATQHRNIIVQYRSWRLRDYTEGESYCLVESEPAMFKQLFEKYWFSVGEEHRFEAFIIRKDKLRRFDKWYKQADSRAKDTTLHKMAEVVLDNQYNGFHFRYFSKRPIGIKVRVSRRRSD